MTCWNAGAERLLGYQEAEIVGCHFARFFTPEDIRSGVPKRELSRAWEEGRASDDRWHVRKDGTFSGPAASYTLGRRHSAGLRQGNV